MSVMAILEQFARAKPLATAAPIPALHQQMKPYAYNMLLGNVPVPPAPVMIATPGSNFAKDAIVQKFVFRIRLRQVPFDRSYLKDEDIL
jgi:hypothetical protein